MTQTALTGDDMKIKNMPFQIIDGDRGANYPKGHEFSTSGYCLFLSAKNVTKDGFNFEQNQFITEEKDRALRKGKLERYDIVLTTRGTVGNVALYDDSCQYSNVRINSGMIIIRCDPSKLKPKYLYFVLKSNLFQNQVDNFRSGSAQPQLPIRDMQNMKLPLPSLEEQQNVIDHVGAIDEKIEQNRKMNETLEQMGQALFRHYFIDNPDAEKWARSTIGENFDVLLGGTPSRNRKEYWDNGTVGWINSGKINEFRITEPSEYITEEALQKSAAKLLPKGTTVIAITGATLGQISRVEQPFAANQSVIGMVPTSILSDDFVYYWISAKIDKLIGHQTGGAQQHINRNNVTSFTIPLPDQQTVEKFQKKISSITGTISNNCFEIQTLATLRDTLLPRLISGKITINE